MWKLGLHAQGGQQTHLPAVQFPMEEITPNGGTILHEGWLELQLQKATAATKSKPAAMKGKGPTKKDHGKTKVPMSKPTAKTKK